MPIDPDKRKLRELKRAVKRRGTKHLRAELKKTLRINPEEAAHVEIDFGRHASQAYNGLDRPTG